MIYSAFFDFQYRTGCRSNCAIDIVNEPVDKSSIVW